MQKKNAEHTEGSADSAFPKLCSRIRKNSVSLTDSEVLRLRLQRATHLLAYLAGRLKSPSMFRQMA